MNDKNLLRPRLCDACESYVIDTLDLGRRLDIHYCRHNQIFAQLKFKDGKLADAMLHGPTTEAEVAALFADARQVVDLQTAALPNHSKTIN